MVSIIRQVIDGYNYIFYELANPTTRDWFLMSNPLKLAVILTGYLYFCTRFGPRYMRDRKPYNLKNVVFVYNVFQVAISLYMLYLGYYLLFFNGFNFYCQALHTDTVIRKEVASATWLYFMAKISELLDTIFFVLRKSNRQVTSLHLHHHTIMPMSSWIAITYYPGGQMILLGTFNAMVHIFMYIYYLIAGLGDDYKKYTWWKKYVTVLQLVQFIIVGIQNVVSLFFECGYPNIFKWLSIIYCSFFLHAFGKFYYNTYLKTKNENKKANGNLKGERQQTKKNSYMKLN